MNEKIFIVIDMKCFYASVECRERGLDPFFTNLVVADEVKGEGTICLAVSPALKKLGIKGRCRLFEIPDNIKYICAKPRMKKYIEYSSEVYAIYLKYFNKEDIFPYSIDEMFIDITPYLNLYKISKEELAKKLMNEIFDKLGIPSACGIGTNLFLAKVSLDILAKKNADNIAFLNEEMFKQKMWEHTPITDFWQISFGTEKRLLKRGIINMKGITQVNQKILFDEFGVDAEILIDHAWGREPCQIADIKNYNKKSTSISSSQILPRNYTKQEARTIVLEMVFQLCLKLVKYKQVTNVVGFYARYSFNDGGSVKHSKKISNLTNSYQILSKVILDIFDNEVDENKLVKKLGFTFSNLVDESYQQFDFFTDLHKIEKEKKVNSAVVEINEKYGKNSLCKGISLKKESTQKERNETIGGHHE